MGSRKIGRRVEGELEEGAEEGKKDDEEETLINCSVCLKTKRRYSYLQVVVDHWPRLGS